MIGRDLGGYRVIEQIGLGGMASVYKAYDPGTDRNVAIKVLPEYYSKDPTFRERFQREARAIARLEHLHILPIFAYGEEEGVSYLVMRLMESGTLKERIQRGPLPLPEASRLLSQIASALDYAHSKGIVHRDVKPSNVALDGEGNAYLTDFGIAKMVAGASDLTGSGLIGTPQYMSPEQAQGGNRDLSPASDQYSLGVILYEMLTGQAPFQAETPVAVILKQLNDPLPPPRSIRHDLPEAAQMVVFKSLAKTSDQRYPSCSTMAAAFAEAIKGAPDDIPTMRAHPSPTASAETMPAPMLAQAQAQPIPSAPRVKSPRAGFKLPGWLIPVGGAALLLMVIFAVLLSSLLKPDTPTVTNTTPSAPSVSFEVPGDSDWSNTGIQLRLGQQVHITASGAVDPCVGGADTLCKPYGPGGHPDASAPQDIGDPGGAQYPLPDGKPFALVARVGGGRAFVVGEGGTFTAYTGGLLQLAVNDFPVDNNAGSFAVNIQPLDEMVVRVGGDCITPSSITTRDSVIVRLGWGSDSVETVESHAEHLSFDIVLDGRKVETDPVQLPTQHVAFDAYACKPSSGTGANIYWDINLGQLPDGDHAIRVEFLLDAAVVDGGSTIGPGSAGSLDATFTITSP